MEVLDLGPTQAEAIEINAGLPEEPTARADGIYTGVLFSELDLPTLDAAARSAPTSRSRSPARCSDSYDPTT